MDIEKTLKNIAVEVYKETGETIDKYHMGIIRGMVLANEEVVNSNYELGKNISGRLKTYNNTYNNLSPTSALMLRWGFGFWICLLMVICSLSYFGYAYFQNKESDLYKQLERRELQIKKFVDEYPKTKKYFD